VYLQTSANDLKDRHRNPRSPGTKNELNVQTIIVFWKNNKYE